MLGQPVRLRDARIAHVPRELPPPNTREHTDAAVDAALPVIKAAGGRAFMLFTTLRALNAAREGPTERPARGARLSAPSPGRRLKTEP
jgi:Rad3-related DNA helicase